MLGNHDYKVVICVNLSMNGCLAFCVGPVIGWRSVKGVSCFSPYETWDRLQPPDFEPDRLEGDRYGWMGGLNEWMVLFVLCSCALCNLRLFGRHLILICLVHRDGSLLT